MLLGTITIARVASDRAADKRTIFLSGMAHQGIDPAEPMLTMLNDAYPISFTARQ